MTGEILFLLLYGAHHSCCYSTIPDHVVEYCVLHSVGGNHFFPLILYLDLPAEWLLHKAWFQTEDEQTGALAPPVWFF